MKSFCIIGNPCRPDGDRFFSRNGFKLILSILLACILLFQVSGVQAVTLPASAALIVDEPNRISQLLQNASFPLTLISFFGFGLLLALTPCVFPMIPILSGIIAGQSANGLRKRSALLSAGYVLGMAVTYALAGVAAALSGAMLAGALQNVWVLGSFSLLFVMLALSMFGYFELQLPASLQTWLNNRMPKGAGSMLGTILMGAISALVVSPCVAAPLAGALLYIAKTGNTFIGGSALFCLALGMGVPLFLVGTLTGSILPKAGVWMELVKKGFGILMLGVAAWLLKPVAPEGLVNLAWGVLLTAGGIGLYRSLQADTLQKRKLYALRGVSAVVVLAGLLLFGDVLVGPRGLSGLIADTRSAPLPPLVFSPVKDLRSIEQKVQSGNRPVMVFITADWCSWCKKMHHTLDDPAVRYRLKGFDLLMADITDTSKDDKKIMRRFGIMGPPGIVFIGADQGKIQVLRSVMGYQEPDVFIKIISSIARR